MARALRVRSLFWLIFTAAWLIPSTTLAQDIERVEQAWLVSTGPTAAERWVSLPHVWRPGRSGDVATYRISLTQERSDFAQPALLIPRASQNIRVYLDNRLIYYPGQTGDHLSRLFGTPHMVSLQGLLTQQGANQLEIQLYSGSTHGALSPLLLGERHALEELAYSGALLRGKLMRAQFGLAIILGLFALLIWFTRRSETHYGAMAVLAAVASLHGANVFWTDLPLPTRIWEWALHSAIPISIWFLTLYWSRLTGEPAAKIRTIAAIYVVASCLCFATLESTRLPLFAGIGHAVSICWLFALSFIAIQKARDPGAGAELRMFGIAGITLSVCGAVDLNLYMSATTGTSLWTNDFGAADWVYLSPMAASIFLAMQLWIMMSSYFDAATTIANAQQNLEHRVALVRAELESEFQQLQIETLDRAVRQERVQIYSALYEDLQDRLTALYLRATDQNQADAAKAALRELGDASRIAQGMTHHLDELLVDIRTEFALRCQQAKVDLTWETVVDPPHIEVDEAFASGLTRASREALTNALRHSGSAQIDCYLNLSDSTLHLVISDAGQGFPANIIEGRGIAGIHRRLQEIGGCARFMPREGGGVEVRLEVVLRERPV